MDTTDEPTAITTPETFYREQIPREEHVKAYESSKTGETYVQKVRALASNLFLCAHEGGKPDPEADAIAEALETFARVVLAPWEAPKV
jgi:hypothetical protein